MRKQTLKPYQFITQNEKRNFDRKPEGEAFNKGEQKTEL